MFEKRVSTMSKTSKTAKTRTRLQKELDAVVLKTGPEFEKALAIVANKLREAWLAGELTLEEVSTLAREARAKRPRR